jgi:hypothetical protein
LPTIFWKGPEIAGRAEAAPRTPDAASARERYLADGRTVAEGIARDPNVLAVWLTGPFELPRVAPGSDLHVAVLLREAIECSYRHVIPEFSEVPRRQEIAYLPLALYERIARGGLSSWGDVFDAHKLRDVVILFDRRGMMDELKRRISAVRPARIFIGREIERLRAELAGAVGDAAAEDRILAARRAARRSLALVALASKRETFSKSKELYARARSFPEPRIEDFERVEGVAGVGADDARRAVEAARELVTYCFERTVG